jgi:hypothetical protein
MGNAGITTPVIYSLDSIFIPSKKIQPPIRMSRKKSILLAILLSIPVILFVLHHYFYHSNNLKPTGFTVNENVLYMSYAHQYLDQENNSLFYSNPFDGEPSSAKIYLQPINFLFAAAMKAGIDPGLAFSLFGLLMVFLCIFTGIKIIQHLLPDHKQQTLIATLFTWGGGLTAIAGLAGSIILTGHSYTNWFDGIYLADPANGWWGLNWGRTLFIPLEAYYHFLFLLIIYLVLKQKWTAAIVASLFLSISHPFTGIEFLLIMNGWLFFEKIICKSKNIPYWYWAGILGITAFHLWYYMAYLNNSPEHRQLFSQYSAGWTYSLMIAIPAYCLVGGLSLFSAYINKPIKKFLAVPHQRLFLCWALISFLLSKHEWFINPMQPIHFTRGYTWAALFLLSIPGINLLINYFQINKGRKWILSALIVLFLSDNLLWTANILRKKDTIEWEGHLTKDTEEILNYLKNTTSPNDLLTGNATLINYLANVYSPANSWVSHPFNTPKIDERTSAMKIFLQTGIPLPEWKSRKVIIVINKKSEPLLLHSSLQINKSFENSSYIIFTQ